MDSDDKYEWREPNQTTAVDTLKMYRNELRARLMIDKFIRKRLELNDPEWIGEILPTVEKHLYLEIASIDILDNKLSLSGTDQAKVIGIKKPPDNNG